MSENPYRGSGDWTFWRAPWWEAAHSMGARFQDFTTRISPEGPAAIQLDTEHGTITLLRYWHERPSTTHEIRALFWSPRCVSFELVPTSRSGWMKRVERSLGVSGDVSIGDRFLDARFDIDTECPEEVKAVLSDGSVRKVLLKLPPFPIRARGIVSDLQPLEGVHEIVCPFDVVPVQPRRIQLMFELMHEMLRRFAEAGPHGDAVARHIERLAGPGGSVSMTLSQGIELKLWDGDVERARAVQALGLLGDTRAIDPLIRILDDSSEAVRLVAARALGRFRDVRAIAALVRFLGDGFDDGFGGAVGLRSAAAEALGELGAGPLVRAFDQALQGDASRLSTLAGAHRPEVIEALVRTLASPDRRTFAHAYTALADMNALESLPILEKKLAEVKLPALRQDCEAAIERLKSLQKLPRAAGAPPDDVSTLPRQASPDVPRTRGLPRSASEAPKQGQS